MDMSHMDHSDMSSSSSSSSHSMSMAMVFMNAHDTPLFSSQWTPSSTGSYAGTCIFLIILSIIARLLVAFKAAMERHWLAVHLNRRYVAIAGKSTEAGRIDADPDAKAASLVTAQGVEESVKVVRRLTHEPMPWRFSVDLPRAFIFLCITGVSYLLMLAVMTMNVGYFCSVLGGAFLGELMVGRFIQWDEHSH
ncbi:Ctr copper transporter [Aspergillus floccosus]